MDEKNVKNTKKEKIITNILQDEGGDNNKNKILFSQQKLQFEVSQLIRSYSSNSSF